jgi:alpha-L-rhamnosidase
VIVPFVLYNFTGDKEIIKDAFEPSKKLIKFYDSIHNGDSVMRRSYIKWFLGDWCTPEKTTIDIPFVNTLAAYFATEKVLEMYDILGESEGKEEFIDFKDRLKKAINEFYFDEKTLDYAGGIQGANVMPALYGIASDGVREKLLLRTAEKYEKEKHFDTGIVMTPVVLDALSMVGREDIGYALLTEKTAPSFYNMVEGETTLPEHWLSHYEEKATISHCHPMFGAVLAWVYKNVGGLNLSKLYQKKIIVAPKLIKQVNSSSISKKTAYGEASVSYHLGDGFEMKISVPYGLTAEVVLPCFIKDVKVNGRAVSNTFSVDGGEYLIVAKV